jgi:hypothetical protein
LESVGLFGATTPATEVYPISEADDLLTALERSATAEDLMADSWERESGGSLKRC